MDLLKLLIKSSFVDNMIFAFFFGCAPAASKQSKQLWTGQEVIFVFDCYHSGKLFIENYVLKRSGLVRTRICWL